MIDRKIYCKEKCKIVTTCFNKLVIRVYEVSFNFTGDKIRNDVAFIVDTLNHNRTESDAKTRTVSYSRRDRARLFVKTIIGKNYL